MAESLRTCVKKTGMNLTRWKLHSLQAYFGAALLSVKSSKS